MSLDRLTIFGTGSDLYDLRLTTLAGIRDVHFSGAIGGGATVMLRAAQVDLLRVSYDDFEAATELALDMRLERSVDLSAVTFEGVRADRDRLMITGTSGGDTVIGSILGDVIEAAGGNDTLFGGAGA